MLRPAGSDPVERLVSREEIRDLAVRYGFAVDDRDEQGLRRIFAQDSSLRTMNGPAKGQGIESVVGYYRDRWKVLGATNHFTHGHLIEFDDADPDRATGVVAAHAEVVISGTTKLTALRYHDTYVREDGRWLFAERVQAYMYFLRPDEYAEALPTTLRMRRAEGDWFEADWPVLDRQD